MTMDLTDSLDELDAREKRRADQERSDEKLAREFAAKDVEDEREVSTGWASFFRVLQMSPVKYT